MDRKAGNNLPRKEKKPAFPSPSEFLASQNNTILRESRHHYLILLPIECQRRFEWTP